jgi:hypothetical protein
MVNYRCTRRMSTKCPPIAMVDLESNMIVNILHAHVHTSNILRETACKEVQKVIEGYHCGPSLYCGDPFQAEDKPGAICPPRGSLWYQKVQDSDQGDQSREEKGKIMGHSATIPKSVEEIKENLPDMFWITLTGGVILRYCNFVDDQKKKLMMTFMSDHDGWVLG